ncbi:MAG: aldo/keto reductase [Acholeplasmataceae bacterium]
MNKRRLTKSGVYVSEISLGTWQLGGKWGDQFSEEVAYDTLNAATINGIDCYDTADVYQGGASEIAIGKYIKALDHKPFVITKIGRKSNPHTKESYNEENIRKYINESRARLDVSALDMVLLHCPPSEVYNNKEVFDILDQIKEEGLIKHYGVSVEKVSEALDALKYPNVEAIEIIFNMFRLKPTEVFFKEAQKQGVGIIVRVPLASGLLTGKYNEKTSFNENDHRTTNRHGERFDKGETFSGVDYDLGLKAVKALKDIFKTEELTRIAIRWILMFDAVSTVIPGASQAKYVYENAASADLKPLTNEEMDAVKKVYDTLIKPSIHENW